ncbi:hypothetical protein J6590_072738 [Homalodisca vitripennis]|nr:hypothetical protein J6590_072738 [Homalodisca vitripennis]
MSSPWVITKCSLQGPFPVSGLGSRLKCLWREAFYPWSWVHNRSYNTNRGTDSVSVIFTERSGAEVRDNVYCSLDQPSTSSTNRSELVCRKYYLRLGLIAYLLSERSGAEVSASLDIVYCSLNRVSV